MIKLNNSELQTVSAGYDFSIKAAAVGMFLSFATGLLVGLTPLCKPFCTKTVKEEVKNNS